MLMVGFAAQKVPKFLALSTNISVSLMASRQGAIRKRNLKAEPSTLRVGFNCL
jgi:hypothetical protein